MTRLFPVGRRAMAAMLGLAIAACSTSRPVRIGVVMTADGVIGAQLAAADINATGGIDGRTLELVVVEEQNATLPQEAITTAERMAADSRVLAVIGHHRSSVSLAASQIYNARRLAQIAPNSSAPLYTQAGPYSFRLVASDVHQAAFLAARIAGMSPVPRIAVLYVNNDYGRAFRGLLQAALREAGTPPVYEAPFLDGEARFTQHRDDLLRSLEGTRPDLLVWIGGAPELALLRSELREAHPRLRVLASDDVTGDGAAFARLRPVAGDLMVSYVDVTAARPALRRVASRFESVSGRPLTSAAALTYDAVSVVATAMRSGAADREGIRRYLESLSLPDRAYPGITGGIRFDVNGDGQPSYVLFEVAQGGLRLVGP